LPELSLIEGNQQVLIKSDYYYVGLLFGALASTVCGYLWLKSRYILEHWQPSA
jgi:hypothetical protein